MQKFFLKDIEEEDNARIEDIRADNIEYEERDEAKYMSEGSFGNNRDNKKGRPPQRTKSPTPTGRSNSYMRL